METRSAPQSAAPHRYPAGSVFGSLADIAGKKLTVMGVGLNRGGEETIRFFLRHGAFVTATDTKGEDALRPTIDALKNDPLLDTSRLRFALAGHNRADFSGADAVLKNPVVKYEGNEFLGLAPAVETDISVFLALTKAPIIAVTGSKGKSTTASAIHHGLCGAGFSAYLGGNITVSPLSFLEKTAEDTPVVLELSSWQLRDLRGRGLLRPKIAVITTIVRDHQDWYAGMEDYVADKKLIYADQGAGDWTICLDDAWGRVFASETRARVIRLDPEAVRREPLLAPLAPGLHNRLNIRAAALALGVMGVSAEKAAEIFSTWRGVPHRLERFHAWAIPGAGSPAVFYNDTTATVPEAVVAAAAAFEKPVRLIAGGTDKRLDFTPLADAVTGKAGKAARPRSVHLLSGTGTDKLRPLLDARGVPYFGPFDSLDGLLVHLKTLMEKERAGDEIVVFSPGAASFGMFRNEFDRGDTFKQKVTEIFRQ